MDGGRTISPKENSWNKDQFNDSVGKLTPYGYENAKEAVKEAAKNGQGVAFIVGSQNTRDTQELLNNMQKLKEQNPGMQFVFVDKDKVAKDPNAGEWRDWIKNNTNNDNLAFTSLQSVKAKADGSPSLDKVVSTHWGGDITTSLTDQSRFAKQFTREYEGKYKFEEPKPLDVEGSEKAIGEKMDAGRKATTKEAIIDSYLGRKNEKDKFEPGAIALADKIDQNQVAKDMAATEKDLQAATKEFQAKSGAAGKSGADDTGEAKQLASKVSDLQNRMKQLEALKNAPAKARAEFGEKLIELGNKSGNKDLNAAGEGALQSAAKKDPTYFQKPENRKHLNELGMDDKAINDLTGGNLYAADEKSMKELYAKARQDGPEGEAAKAQIAKTMEELYDKAAAAAKKDGVPLVIKFGADWCIPCKKLEKELPNKVGDLNGAKLVSLDYDYSQAFLAKHGIEIGQDKKDYVASLPTLAVYKQDEAGKLIRQGEYVKQEDKETDTSKMFERLKKNISDAQKPAAKLQARASDRNKANTRLSGILPGLVLEGVA